MKNKYILIAVVAVGLIGLFALSKSKASQPAKKMQYGNGQTVDVQDYEHLDYGNESTQWDFGPMGKPTGGITYA